MAGEFAKEAVMIDYARSKELFSMIYPDENAQRYVENYIKLGEAKIKKALKQCEKGHWNKYLKKTPIFKLALVYLYLPTLRDKYSQSGISDEIFFDTMGDIAIWIDDCKKNLGEIGLDELNWIMNHMKMEIFKIGRLQYQKTRYPLKKPYVKGNEKIMPNDKIWNVHIPRGEKLAADLCKQSFQDAQDFIRTHFSNYPDNKFMCISWFLYSKNKEFMDKYSNILAFSSLFDVVDENENPEQAYRWIFDVKVKSKALLKNKRKNGRYSDADALEKRTRLQRDCISYILKGGSLGDGVGLRIV